MKIGHYNLSLTSSRGYDQETRTSDELLEWGTRTGEDKSVETVPAVFDRVTVSTDARRAEQSYAKKVLISKRQEIIPSEQDQGMDPKLMTLKRMIEFLTGKKIRLIQVTDYTGDLQAVSSEPPPSQMGEASPEPAWGMRYTNTSSYYESEQTSFLAEGIVHTIDGSKISFSMDLTMSREYFSEERIEITAGTPLIDPLVINYSGTAAELSDLTFEFDLDNDGKDDTLRQLAPGSGFLSFDKNMDGKINNGSELFGPATGNGFKELSAYDEDDNNWIDERDSIYDQLSLWYRENDQDILLDLRSANVGAIYLDSTETSFDLTGTNNALFAKIRNTGIYLKEDGRVATVQHIDFTV